MKPLLPLLAAAPLLLAATTAVAGTPDAIVQAQLTSRGIKFEVDDDGDFKMIFTVGDQGRTQIAYVRSVTAQYGTVKVREIWSPGYRSESDAFPAAVANALLVANHHSKLGAWEAQGKFAMFVVKVPADANAEQLVDAVQAAVQSADTFEATITGAKDEF
jgi:hypothetical protein